MCIFESIRIKYLYPSMGYFAIGGGFLRMFADLLYLLEQNHNKIISACFAVVGSSGGIR